MSKMLEVAQKAMEAVDAGENVFDYLEKAGYNNPSSTWYMLKQHAKKHDPDLYERMAALAVGRRKPNPAPAKAKPVETPVISPEEAETVFFGGKAHEKAEKAEQNAPKTEQNTGDHVSAEDFRKTVEFNGKEFERMNKPSPTCCQPARPSGVTVPDELPICALKSRVWGEWHLSSVAGGIHLVWDDPISHEARCISMTAADWKRLAEEIPMAIRQLGL